MLAGIERADSISLDAHKWLFQPFEAGCVLVRDVATLVRAFSVNPDYLQDTKLGMEHVNFADRGYQLTRSFRALKVWMSIQTFGLSRIRAAITRAIELADEAGRLVARTPGLELLSPPSLGVLCFRYRPQGAEWSPEPHREAERGTAGARDRIANGDDLVDPTSWRVFTATLHHVAPDDLGRRARDDRADFGVRRRTGASLMRARSAGRSTSAAAPGRSKPITWREGSRNNSRAP